MSKTVQQKVENTVVLFGLKDGKPRAGKFSGTDIVPARKAASELGLAAIEVKDASSRSLATKIPEGRIGGNEDTLISLVPRAIVDQLNGLRIKSRAPGIGPWFPPGLAMKRLPPTWQDIKIGDLVLTQDSDPKDGWWQMIVIGAKGDLFKLKWALGGEGTLQKHRCTIGLISPNVTVEPEKKHSGPKKSAYPLSLQTISVGNIILAQEHGPCLQWWECKVLEVEQELIKLEWISHPHLPPFYRARSAIGLICPNPKTR